MHPVVSSIPGIQNNPQCSLHSVSPLPTPPLLSRASLKCLGRDQMEFAHKANAGYQMKDWGADVKYQGQGWV